ncbi:MAG TPA: cupin domain-containing protein [Dehalococcoidia bacterium]|nr:cupin domain-containing protein [Dehalococcoidia bacterium]
MKSSVFPALVRNLPEADLPFDGLRGWLFQGELGQILFNESRTALAVPEHSHGDQWGVVLDGKIDLTIGADRQTYRRGDTYFIPDGTPHQARIYPGYRAIDYFADRNRYHMRSHTA